MSHAAGGGKGFSIESLAVVPAVIWSDPGPGVREDEPMLLTLPAREL
jgi:hypothetical protein